MPEKLKVCILTNTFYPVIGGTQQQVKALSKRLRAKGIEVSILTRWLPGTEQIESIDGVQVNRVGRANITDNTIGALVFITSALKSLVRHHSEFDVIHAHMTHSPAIIAALAKIILRKEAIVTIHSNLEILQFKRSLKGTIKRKFLFKILDGFVVICTRMKAELANAGIDPRKLFHLPNGVDISRFRPLSPSEKKELRARLNVPTDRQIILFVGRLIEGKGLHVLLKSYSKVIEDRTDALLLIVGGGPEESTLKRLATSLGIDDRVMFMGMKENVLPYFQMADLFVLPSQMEGLSVALLEAMACGLPAVVTRVGGSEDLIRHKSNGLLVEYGDAAQLGHAMLRLLADTDTALRMGRAARVTIVESFSLDAVAKAHIKLYRELLTRHESP